MRVSSHDTPMRRWALSVKLPSDPAGCWEWIGGGRNGCGYGRLIIEKKRVYAHRYSYLRFKGDIPQGFTVDHLCRNTNCVNPDHLEAVTHGENVRRGTSPMAQQAKQTHCRNGHPLSGDNLYRRASGKRECLTCITARNQRRYPNARRH